MREMDRILDNPTWCTRVTLDSGKFFMTRMLLANFSWCAVNNTSDLEVSGWVCPRLTVRLALSEVQECWGLMARAFQLNHHCWHIVGRPSYSSHRGFKNLTVCEGGCELEGKGERQDIISLLLLDHMGSHKKSRTKELSLWLKCASRVLFCWT